MNSSVVLIHFCEYMRFLSNRVLPKTQNKKRNIVEHIFRFGLILKTIKPFRFLIFNTILDGRLNFRVFADFVSNLK